MAILSVRIDDDLLDMIEEKRGKMSKSEFIRILVEGYGKGDVVIQPKNAGDKVSYDSVVKDGEQNTPSGDKWKEDPYWKRILALREKAGRPLSLDEEMTETIMPKAEWEAMRAKRSRSLSNESDAD